MFLSKKILIGTVIGLALFISGCSGNQTPAHDHSTHDHGDSNQLVEASAKAVFEFQEKVEKGSKVKTKIYIFNKEGNKVEDFDIEHEKLMHMMVIHKNLSYFNHIHPEYKGKGLFEVETDFPLSGDYKIIVEYKPKGTDTQTFMKKVSAAGEPEESPIQKEIVQNIETGKYKVTINKNQLGANQDEMISFDIKETSSGKTIQVEPYLGADGHMVILDKDLNKYIHSHNMKTEGENVDFHVKIQETGEYHAWFQFQHKGEVQTAPFVLEVK